MIVYRKTTKHFCFYLKKGMDGDVLGDFRQSECAGFAFSALFFFGQ
ncbi:hypothetical protein NBRC111894_3151 [Sporolactobacillus inulinus]|uniref:Uncharacterized protein n=1 Tax=Sporolactobacillus inulinus TaxID=2078 RepID=A0A4Y1ZEQ2_9BACL|nr:hypothetical protein NBRC111894_3151 [Sporolactobacillus inulinus]